MEKNFVFMNELYTYEEIALMKKTFSVQKLRFYEQQYSFFRTNLVFKKRKTLFSWELLFIKILFSKRKVAAFLQQFAYVELNYMYDR